ncbi:MAG TPA: hypothetical protein VL122_01795 [Nitrospirota bacterium]|nr:hypothetical protein [Nitrospirota bacterium]
MADILSGTVELTESKTDSKITDASGVTTHPQTQTFYERYTLTYAEMLFPYVNLMVGSGYDRTLTDTKDPVAGETHSALTNFYPQAALALNNPFVHAGAGYTMREAQMEESGTATQATISEIKNAYLGFKPEGLPTLDLQYIGTHTYDKNHEFLDTKNDLSSANTRFTPVKNLDLAFTVTSNDTKNLLTGIDSDQVSENERANYAKSFFDNRVAFSGDYNGYQATNKVTGGSGVVSFQLFPFFGLSDISDIPTLETLSVNQALIDGNLTASSGINIGQGVSFSGDTKLRNIGLDFGTATSVNTLYVYVDRQLPNTVANAFTWSIYISSDNQNWTVYQTNLLGTFNPFTNSFELQFPAITTRYIKASVRPLSVAVIAPPGTDVSNIYVTELQAYSSQPANQVNEKTSSTSQIFDLYLRTALLKDNSLSYIVSYSQASSNGVSATSILTNALTYNKQFNNVFSGGARIEQDDSRTASVSTVSDLVSVTLMAVPLPTITNNLVLSGRRDESQGQSRHSETIFLYNTASLYRGVDVNLSGGVNIETSATGAESTDTLVNAGISIVPNRFFSLSLNQLESETTSTVGPFTMTNRSADTVGNVAWTPVEAIYLAYSISVSSATNQPNQTIQNYSASWSPFSGGALIFTCTYSETKQTTSGTTPNTDRAFLTGIQWNVGPRIQLTASYNDSRTSATQSSEEDKNFSTDLKMSF